MTLSLYSTYKALRREAGQHQAAQTEPAKTTNPIQNSVCHALSLLGMGVEGVSCGGDVTPTWRR